MEEKENGRGRMGVCRGRDTENTEWTRYRMVSASVEGIALHAWMLYCMRRDAGDGGPEMARVGE